MPSKRIGRVDPTLNVVFQEQNPERNCEYPACPKRSSGYEGRKMKVCARCKRVRYCSKECQTTDWREHKQGCKQFEVVADYRGWLNEYDGVLRWAATEALRVNTTDDILSKGLEIVMTYADRVPVSFGTIPSPFYIMAAQIISLNSESLPHWNDLSDLHQSLGIRLEGGGARAHFIFRFLEDPFHRGINSKTIAMGRSHKIDLTEQRISRYTYSVDWEKFLMGVVNGKISVADLSRRVELQPEDEEHVEG